MIHFPGKLFALIAIICSASLVQPAAAEQLPVSGAAPAKLSIQLPYVDRDVLVEKVSQLRSRLIQRKQALLQLVADKQMDGGDALITVIMPGGLLYASYKKARYESAKNELDSVSDDIEEYSDDLLAMQSAPAPLAMAQLP
jgi:hypothetical protein